MKEADVTIDAAIDTEEIFDLPIAIGEAAGLSEPFPWRFRCPVDGVKKEDRPVATFWLHPLSLKEAAACQAAGINPDPGINDMDEILKQNRFYAPLLIDKGKGWSGFFRKNGTEWKYVPCSKEKDGTDEDPRLQIGELGAFFGLLKARCVSAAVTVAAATEGNSESSSVTPMASRGGSSGKQNVSPGN
jgi:hypothetical protein